MGLLAVAVTIGGVTESFDELLSEARRLRREEQEAEQQAADQQAAEIAAAAARARALLPEVDKALAALRAAVCPRAGGRSRRVHRIGERREGCYGRRTLGGRWEVHGAEIHTVHELRSKRASWRGEEWPFCWRAPSAGEPTVLAPGNERGRRGPNFRKSWTLAKDLGVWTRELSLLDFADLGRLKWRDLYRSVPTVKGPWGGTWTLDCDDALRALLQRIAERLASQE